MEFFLKTYYGQTLVSAVVACVSFYHFKDRNTSIRLIGFLFLCGFSANAVAYIFAFFLDKNVNIVSSIYELAAIIIIAALFDVNTSKRYTKWFLATVLISIIFGIINLLFFQKTGASYNKLILSFTIIAYCLFYFYRLISDLPTRQVHTLPMFWFASGFLFFHAAAFILFSFMDYLVTVLNDNLVTYWSFHNILSILQHGIILVGLYYDIKYPKIGRVLAIKGPH